MLKELGNEIIELFKANEVKDTQIAELRRENEGLRANIEPLNAQISELQGQIASLEEEKNVTLQTIQDKENTINSLNTQIVELQGQIENLTATINSKNEENRLLNEQASLKLDEVKAIIKELKGLIVNA